MREAILQSIRSRRITTFQHLTVDVAGFRGTVGMFTPERDSIIIWHRARQRLSLRWAVLSPISLFVCILRRISRIVLQATCRLWTSVAPLTT